MGLPNTWTLEIEQGATLKWWWAIEHPDGTVPDLVALGYDTAACQVRTASASEGGELILDLSTDNGGIVLDRQQDADGEWWSGYLYAPASVTEVLTPFGEGVYDLQITNGSDVIPVLYGVAVMRPEVTVED